MKKIFLFQKIKQGEKGITLIALVVTIVVLLILATVSIQMLGGDQGIIKQAVDAKDKTKEEGAKEQIAVEVAGSYGIDGKIDIPLLNENLGHIDGIKGLPITSLPTTVELDGVKVVINGNGSTEQILPIEKGKTYDKETTVTVGNDTVTLPGGATVSEIPGEYEKIEDGIVIYIMKDADGDGTIDTPDWSDPDMMQTTYDQFVWVPVPNAVLDLSEDTTGILLSEDSIKSAVQNEIDEKRYPMAIKNAEGNYFGVLYQFSLDGNAVKVEPLISDVNGYKWTPLTTSGNRELAYLTNSTYADASSYNNVGITESSLQSEFNTMVNKVSSKKGFWVGRYETSNMSSSNANDSTNKVTVIKGATTGINNVNWYRMYAQQKSYSKLALGNTTTVTSSMIWGSQWDQIMIWMKGVKNETSYAGIKPFYVINSQGMGNFGTAVGGTGSIAKTGYYAVKNIYDLAGNVYDWSLEANSTYYRVRRRRILLPYK